MPDSKEAAGPRLLVVAETREKRLDVIDREVDIVNAHRRANQAVEDQGYFRAWVIDTLYEAVAPDA